MSPESDDITEDTLTLEFTMSMYSGDNNIPGDDLEGRRQLHLRLFVDLQLRARRNQHVFSDLMKHWSTLIQN